MTYLDRYEKLAAAHRKLSNLDRADFFTKLMFPDWESESKDSKGWAEDDNSWNWTDEPVEDEKDESGTCSWLQQCIVSISPLGDVMVLARERTLALLNRKWDNSENGEVKAKYSLVCSDEVSDDKQDYVTSILCLPLASQKRSSRGRPDWTAVIVGFVSGNVKMLTEDGVLLVVQRFDYSPIVNIKCSTFEPPRCNAMAEQHEEMVILYRKSVVVIQGIGLYNMLRACRNQVAKAAAMGGDAVTPPPLEYKKWALHDHTEVADCENVGTVSSSLFDQMMHDSMNRGYGGFLGGSSRKLASASSLFVATGTCPYVGFYYAVESNAPPFVSEAMLAAAQKLSSYFTGFFRGAKPPPDKKPMKIETGISLPNRFELRDLRRNGLAMCTSPNRRLTAISDDFGRVILIDNHEGIAVRIWKGYREAQCGWIEVGEDRYDDSSSGSTAVSKPRVALFLVIYCRRRGILEIWSAQQGPRVAAFNVGKLAVLVSCNHCILGLTDVKSVLQGWAQSSRCYLLESDGTLRTISIPFHCALSDKYSKRARDLHLLKKLKELLKSGDYQLPPSKLSENVLDMKTASVRHQALDVLLQSNDTRFDQIDLTVSQLLASLNDQSIESLDFESRFLLARCLRLRQLLDLYRGVEKLQEVGTESLIKEVSDVVDDEKPLQALSAILHLSEQEIDSLLSKVDRLLIVKERRRGVRFQDSDVLSIGQFLSCFETNVSHVPKDSTAATPLTISLISHLSSEQTVALSRLLFEASLRTENGSPHALLTVLLQSGVNELLLLLIECWLSLDDVCNKWQALHNLHTAVIFLASRSIADYNSISPCWTSVRARLAQSENTVAALTAAVVCRGAAVTLLTARQKQALEEERDRDNADMEDFPSKSCESISLSDWEGVDLDTEQWNLIVKQLEDLVFLSTLMKRQVPKPLLCEASSGGNSDRFLISVASFMEHGRGGISELVSQWLAYLNLQTLLYVFGLNDGVVGADIREKGTESMARSSIEDSEDLKAEFEKQKHRFPHSLQQDILLGNCCWEFAIQWNKNKEEAARLNCAVVCLKFTIGMCWSRGLASLLWHTFLRKPFTAAAQLTEKVGKAPKDRLCRKDVGMSDTALERFLQCSVDFLDVLSRMSSLPRDTRNVCIFPCEDPWQETTGPAPLVDRAIGQKEPTYFLVSHHQQLALVLQMIFTFSLKCKPLSLYDTQSKSLFFGDLSANSTVTKESLDLAIVNSRMQFLCRSLSAVVQTIPDPFFSDLTTIPPPPALTSDHSLASCWMGKILELAMAWQLDCDQLRRHYVCELYSSGLDSLALELLPSIVDNQVMGSQLILIAGQRVFNVLQSSGDTFVEKIALFPPTVTTWLKTLKQDGLRCPCPPLPMTVSLVAYILNVIPERQAEHKVAFNLLEALQLLISSENPNNDIVDVMVSSSSDMFS